MIRSHENVSRKNQSASSSNHRKPSPLDDDRQGVASGSSTYSLHRLIAREPVASSNAPARALGSFRQHSKGDIELNLTKWGCPLRIDEEVGGSTIRGVRSPNMDPILEDAMQDSVPKKPVLEPQEYPNHPHPALEFPPLYFLLKPFPLLLKWSGKLYQMRWSAGYPLQRRVYFSRHLRKLGVHLTWGELLLLLPLVGLLIAGTFYTFLYPSVGVTGHVSRVPLIICFATAMRNSFVTLLIGLPFERANYYHKLCGWIAFVNGILHTYVACIEATKHSTIQVSPTDIVFGDQINTSGTFLLCFLTSILVSALPFVRHRLFELFYYLHVVFAASMVACAFYHSGILVPILASVCWGGDLFMRRVIMAGVRYPKKASIKIISDTVVEVSFPKTKGFDFNPGQYVFMAVKELGIFQWHPFSLSSSPGQKIVTLHIRRCGAWTNALYLHAMDSKTGEITILLEGPYGSVGVDIMSERYSTIMLLSGGIGVTPMQSICNQLVHEHITSQRRLRKLTFLWVERDPVVTQDLEVVRRCSLAQNVAEDLDVMTMASSVHIAKALLTAVPQSLTTDYELEQIYADQEEFFDEVYPEDEDDNVSFFSALLPKRGRSYPPVVPPVCEVGAPRGSKCLDDDCTFLAAAYGNGHQESPGDFFDLKVYLTSKTSCPQLEKQPFVHKGRPDLKATFRKMREEAIANGEERVAVCICAPSKLVSICRNACIKFSDSKLRFDFHSETFE